MTAIAVNNDRPRVLINDFLAFVFSCKFLEPRVVTLDIGVQGHRTIKTHPEILMVFTQGYLRLQNQPAKCGSSSSVPFAWLY